MSITITAPAVDDPFGPGFLVSWSTSFVGPLAPGSFWQLSLSSLVSEDRLARKVIFHTDATESTVMTSSFLDIAYPVPGKAGWQTGDAAQLEILLIEPGFGTAETATVNVTLDRESGQVAELAEWIAGRLAAQPVGLTTAQGEQLTRIEGSVGLSLGLNPLDLLGGLGDAIASSAPLAFGSLGDIIGPLTGDGSLENPPALRVAMGVYFVATEIPPGLGHVHGQSEEYRQRLVQWRTTHVVGGIEMTTEILDAITHRDLWRFRNGSPHAVQYSVLPGVEVFARYWLFP